MEEVGLMVREVWDCMNTDLGQVRHGYSLTVGCQVVAFMLDIKLVRPIMLETNALGVAMVSGHTSGVWTLTGMASTVDTFLPSMNTMARLKLWCCSVFWG